MRAEILVTILTSSLFASAMTMIVSFVKSFFHARKVDSMVLFFIIKTMGTDAIFSGYVSPEDLRFLEECFAEYKRLGGNGFADTLMNRVRVLPLREDE